jgi:hypothetical protein
MNKGYVGIIYIKNNLKSWELGAGSWELGDGRV